MKRGRSSQHNKATATQTRSYLVSKNPTQQRKQAAAIPTPTDPAAAAGPRRGVQPGASLVPAPWLACTALQHGYCSWAGPGPQRAPTPNCTAPQCCLPQLPVSTALQPRLRISMDVQGQQKEDRQTANLLHTARCGCVSSQLCKSLYVVAYQMHCSWC